MTNTPESDDVLTEGLRATAISGRVDAFLDALNDTKWQPAPPADVDGRAR